MKCQCQKQGAVPVEKKKRRAYLCRELDPVHAAFVSPSAKPSPDRSSYHIVLPDTLHAVRSTAETPEKRCFCMDVTCDNLLTAVKQTVEEDTHKLSMRRETELTITLREAVFEEQQLSAKVGRFEGEQETTLARVLRRVRR